MTIRTQCSRCRKMDEEDAPFEEYPVPTLMQYRGNDELVMLPADNSNEPDHLCDTCAAEYAKVVAEFMGEGFVLLVPAEDDDANEEEDA